MWINKEKYKKGMKLDIGSGDPSCGEVQAGSDFVLQDVEDFPGIDLVCDIRNLADFINHSFCSHIRASHVMEHFGTKEIPVLFAMIYSLLEDGGVFEIIVPNFEWHCQLLMQGEHEQAVHYCFGGQLDEWDYHKTAFTGNILYKRLKEAGFIIDDFYNESSLTAFAKK